MSAQFNDPALLARVDRRGHGGGGGLLCFFLVKVTEQKEEDSLYIL